MWVWRSVYLIYLWHITKIMGTLPSTCEREQPTECYISPSRWQAGWWELWYRICWLGPALPFDEMTSRVFGGRREGFVTLKHHQYHSLTQSTLCKNIHYLNALTEIADKVWDTPQLLKNTWNHKQKNERPYFERMKANRETGRNEVSIRFSKMMKRKSCCKNRTIKCIGP